MKSFIAALRSLVLPFGAISGARIVLDGVNGVIQIYDSTNTIVIDISANGIHVQGTTHQWDVNAAVGFLSRRFPDDGTRTQIFDAGVFVTPQSPAPVSGITVATPGELFAGNQNFGGGDAPFVNMISPIYTGKTGFSSFIAQGQSSGSAVDNSLASIFSNEIDALAASRVRLNAPQVIVGTGNSLQDSNNHYFMPGENGAFIQPVLAGNSSFVDHVNFTHTFSNPPCVMTNIQDGSGNTKTWMSRAINVTTTGFDYFFFQPAAVGAAGGSSATLTWTATEFTP